MKIAIIALLMPPGIFVLLAALAFYFGFIKSRAGLAKVFLLLAIVIGWSFSTEAMGRLLSTAIISQVDSTKEINPQDIDMIVVLSGGMQYVGAGYNGWLPKKESYLRGAVAFELQDKVGSRMPILISGGRTEGLKYPSEAKVLLSQFDRNMAQITPTILEENSTNTYENALQSVAIMKSREADNIFLVTSEVHMLRALAAFRGRGVDPVAIPVFTLPRGELTAKDFVPSWEGVELTAKAIYEIYGIINYLFTDKIRVSDVFYKS